MGTLDIPRSPCHPMRCPEEVVSTGSGSPLLDRAGKATGGPAITNSGSTPSHLLLRQLETEFASAVPWALRRWLRVPNAPTISHAVSARAPEAELKEGTAICSLRLQTDITKGTKP